MLLVSNQERLPYKCCDELLFSYDLLVRARRILRRNGRNNKSGHQLQRRGRLPCNYSGDRSVNDFSRVGLVIASE
jgi:hypothetical protein